MPKIAYFQNKAILGFSDFLKEINKKQKAKKRGLRVNYVI